MKFNIFYYLFIIYLQIFSNEIFRKKLTEWIAADDQSFTIIELLEFCLIINTCNPGVYIPLANTIRSDILKLYKNYQRKNQNH